MAAASESALFLELIFFEESMPRKCDINVDDDMIARRYARPGNETHRREAKAGQGHNTLEKWIDTILSLNELAAFQAAFCKNLSCLLLTCRHHDTHGCYDSS
eukprot:6458196-Amphidinium_carterae.1